MEIEELKEIGRIVFIIRNMLRANIRDTVARGMIDELYDQLKEKDDPEASYILEQLLMIKVLLAAADAGETKL